MDTMEAVWQQIEDWMSQHAPHLLQQLAPGADEEALKGLERDLGITLPDDMRASYLRHNGGHKIKLVTSMNILPVEGIIDNWQMLRELLDDEDWATLPPHYFVDEGSGWETGPIQPVWWNARWVPVATDNAGNLTCVDLAPAPGGAVGQIIDWDHECGPSQTLFPSFLAMLRAYAKHLKDGTGEEDEEGEVPHD